MVRLCFECPQLLNPVARFHGRLPLINYVRLSDPHTGQLLREHLHQARGRHRIQDQDRPKQTPLITLQLLSRADKAGAQIGGLCRGMHQKDGETAVRRHRPGCLRRRPGSRHLRLPLRAALSRAPTQLPLSLRQVDPLIRQLTLYRDFIENKTKESEA